MAQIRDVILLVSLTVVCLSARAMEPAKKQLRSIVQNARSIETGRIIAAACVPKRGAGCLEYVYIIKIAAESSQIRAKQEVAAGSEVVAVRSGGGQFDLFELQTVPEWVEKTSTWVDSKWVIFPQKIDLDGLKNIRVKQASCALGISGLNSIGPRVCRFDAASRYENFEAYVQAQRKLSSSKDR